MRMYDLILKKRHGLELTDAEIRYMIKGFTDGTIPDYQMSAMCMAILFNSMTDKETATLTLEIAKSGDTVNLSEFEQLSVDKHSTGGVGDKTTLIIAPIVAACGVKLAKMSGRGLGHTGGTIDKLESIEGYKTTVSCDDFLKQTREIGVAVIGQSGNMTPADKKLYALRDVTATVDSIPLIVSSIMGKKLAAGAKNIVLDVKLGSGAFMRNLDDAKALAEKMVVIGKECGRNTAAVITNMDEPLGNAVGNSLEVIEAISVLKNECSGDLRSLCVTLSSIMLSLSLKISEQVAIEMVINALDSGKALAKFKEWIAYQGGNPGVVDDISLFKKSEFTYEIKSEQRGYITKMDTESIGIVASILGAGRQKKEDKIDFSAGLILNKKTGDYVEIGDTLATLYTNNVDSIYSAVKLYSQALKFDSEKPQKVPIIIEKII